MVYIKACVYHIHFGFSKAFNASTKCDRFSLLWLEDFSFKLCSQKIFLEIDILKNYHNIPMHEEVETTAASTFFGLFKFLYMMFGSKKPPVVFQRYNESSFCNVDCAFTYQDDILIVLIVKETCLNDLDEILNILNINDTKMFINKYILLQKKLKCEPY